MNKINKLWEERSQFYGSAIEGVLPKSFPLKVNQYLDEWMFSEIKRGVRNDKNFRILDLGCGYGRLSQKLLKNFPNIKISGIDIAERFVDLYNQQLSPRGTAIKGDIRKLPFTNKSFDLVFMVTTLMYLNKKADQDKAVRELFRVLKDDGQFVVIERNPIGQSILSIGGLVNKFRSKKDQEIPSVSFKREYLHQLLEENGGVVNFSSAIPFWTIFIHLIILLTLISDTLGEPFLKLISKFDKIFNWFLTPSMYISYIGKKKTI